MIQLSHYAIVVALIVVVRSYSKSGRRTANHSDAQPRATRHAYN